MRPFEQAWRVLKEDFDLQQALDANMDSDGQLAQALAQARNQGPVPDANLQSSDAPSVTQYPRPPRNYPLGNRMDQSGTPSTNAVAPTRQTTLPSELTAGASKGKKDFRDIKFPSSFGQ